MHLLTLTYMQMKKLEFVSDRKRYFICYKGDRLHRFICILAKLHYYIFEISFSLQKSQN